jgi:hypothetical protein
MDCGHRRKVPVDNEILQFVIPTSRAATRRNLLFADGIRDAVQETQTPRVKIALGMTMV